MIRLVTFDFWQTLVSETPGDLRRREVLRLEGIAAVLARAGRPTAAPALEAAYEASGRALVERFWASHHDLPHREQVKIFLELAAPGVTADLSPELFEQAVAAYISPVLRPPPAPTPGAVDALGALTRLGVMLGIVSNTGRTPGVVLRRVLDRHGLLRYFTVIAYSDEVGYRKPHPAIFRHALNQAATDAGQAVHIGDEAGTDVAGARAAGMRAGHFRAAGGDGAPDADFTVHDLAEVPARLIHLR